MNSSKFYGSRACLALHVLYLSEVELQWIISGERDIEASSKVLGQRVAVIVEEQWVVTEGRHGYANMCQIVQILQHGDLWIYSKACTCGYRYIWLKQYMFCEYTGLYTTDIAFLTVYPYKYIPVSIYQLHILHSIAYYAYGFNNDILLTA